MKLIHDLAENIDCNAGPGLTVRASLAAMSVRNCHDNRPVIIFEFLKAVLALFIYPFVGGTLNTFSEYHSFHDAIILSRRKLRSPYIIYSNRTRISPHKPVYAKDETGKPLAYLRIKDENILATPIHLRVWQQSDSPRGELIRYTEREQLLLEQLEHGTLLSLNRYCRQTGLSRRAAEHLLAKFVRYDIVEPVFENHKFYFRIKNE